MENIIDSQGWFAVQVKPRHEKSVSSLLAYKGMEQFLPLYVARNRWRDRMQDVQLPLFPGYVFCKFNPSQRTPILSTPGVFGVVRFGRDLAAIDPAEIDSLQCLMRSGLSVEPWPRVEIGQVVDIEAGPLAGCKGLGGGIKKRLRLVLSVTLLHRSVFVELA